MRNDSVSMAIKNPTGPDAREILSKYMPGFVESCREAVVNWDLCVVLNSKDFGKGEMDVFMAGLAVMFATGIGVKRVVMAAPGYENDNVVGRKMAKV